MATPEIVSREQWLKARLDLMDKEKAFTRERDALSAARRALPWVRIEKDYRFDSESGTKTFNDLFGDCQQLMTYHFMFDSDWEAGCKSCSFWADSYNGIIEHLRARDVSFVAVSKAPLATLLGFRQRMGWTFPWVCSPDNEFGHDFGVSYNAEQMDSGGAKYNHGTAPAFMNELPGLSVFIRRDGEIFHTYSCYARGLDMLNAAYHHLDLAPLGRNEDKLDYPMAWVRLRDEY